MGKEDEIYIESWNRPGYLEIKIGNNGTTRVFDASFRGLDPNIASLGKEKLSLVIEQIDLHYAALLSGAESIGLRRLRLCEYTKEGLIKMIR